MEVIFEYSVECEKMSDAECDTVEKALEYANERYQELCDDGDYDHSETGTGYIYCVCLDTRDVLMKQEVDLFADDAEIADGR